MHIGACVDMNINTYIYIYIHIYTYISYYTIYMNIFIYIYIYIYIIYINAANKNTEFSQLVLAMGCPGSKACLLTY